MHVAPVVVALISGARGDRYVMTANEGERISYGSYNEVVRIALGD